MKVIKRDGAVVPFSLAKIQSAILRANTHVSGETLTKKTIDAISRRVAEQLRSEKREALGVEHIQDLVEEQLIVSGFAKTAKCYILYRAKRAQIRNLRDDLASIYSDLTFQDSKDVDNKRENANINTDTAMGTMLKYGSEGAKSYYSQYVIPEHIARADADGEIHIHDKDFYTLTETCCQIDLKKLFEGGFSTGHGYLREPGGIGTYSALACIAIQANQNEMHGGQSVPNFDYAMADGVRKTYRRNFLKYLGDALEDAGIVEDGSGQSFVKRFDGKLPSYDEGSQDAFEDIFELGLPLDAVRHVVRRARRETANETHQAMEALVHNLNTMHSRAGAQVPFSSINYGTDTSPEGRLVIQELLRATEEGLGDGETPIFPVQIFKVKEGVNYNEGDPNYDLFKLAMRVSAKRLFPNFSFIDAPFNLQYYKPGDYNTEVAYMGCRTRVMGNHYNPSQEVTCGRGNLSFTSVNLPRIGIEAKGDIGKFYKILDERIDLCVEQLLHRFKIQCSKRVYNYPFLMGEGVWIGSDQLQRDSSVAEVLKNGTLSVGFIGLAETLVALIGKHHGENEKAWRLGYEIISHMRQRMDEKSEETGLNFTLLATPAEGLSGTFIKKDKKKFGIIPGVTDRDYYTNSFHVPVYYPINAFEKINKEAPFHALTNAGHISYVEVDGDIAKNIDAFESIIRHMKESGIGYGSVNHPVDRDPVCGYVGLIGDVCPRCGRHAGEGITVAKMKELRKKHHNVPDYHCLIT